MDGYRTISPFEAAAVLIGTIIGVGVLALPRVATEAAGTGAPFITLLGIIVAWLGLWLLTVLGMRFPNQSIITYGEEIMGKWIGRLGSILVIVFFAALCALTVREFGEVVVSSILKRTPLQVTVIALLILAAISARNDIVTFAYIHFFYVPFVLAPAVLIVTLALKNSHAIYLFPIIGNNAHLPSLVQGVLVVAALFQGSFVHTIVIPFMRQPKKALTASVWGMSIAGGLYLAIVIVTLGVFGSEETRTLMFPTLDLAKFTSIPGEFLERLDGLFIIVWVIAVFTTVYSSYFLVVRSLSELFRHEDHRFYSFFVLPFIFIMAILPQNVEQMYEVIETLGSTGLILTVLYPGLLLLISWIRNVRGDDRHEDVS